MLYFLLGILTGIFLKGIIILIITNILFPKTSFVRKKLRLITPSLSERQKVFFIEALKETKEVSWLNLVILKWFEIAKDNFYFHEKMKAIILKKFSFALKQRLIKEIKVNKLVFKDCPFVKKLRIIAKKEFDDLILQMGMKEEDSEEEDDDINNVLVLSKMCFSGDITVNLSVILPGNIKNELEISLISYEGDVVFRIPSKNHLTRFDATFISNPNFEIYFKGEENLLKIKTLKKIFMYSVNKNVIYPAWNSFYLPLLVPSIKNVDHPFFKIDFLNYEKVSEEIQEKIRNYSCMDYKITSKNGNFIKRRGQYYINTKHRLIRYDLSLENEFPYDLFYDFSFFKDLFTTFVTLKQIKALDEINSLVILYFIDASYQFLRIKLENGIIFQCLTTNEFFFFEKKGKILLILQFAISKNLNFTEQRIERISRKFMQKQSKTLGSVKLHNLLSYSRRKANIYFKKELIYPEKCKILYKFCELKKSFSKIKEFKKEDYFVKELKFVDYEIIRNTGIRLLLFGGSFVAQTENEEGCYTTILSEKENEILINSLEEENLIIDFESSYKNIIFYEFNKNLVKISSKEQIKKSNFLNFINLFNLYTKFYSLKSDEKFEEVSWNDELEIPYDTKKGSLSLEFYNKADTQIQLSIYDKETNIFLLKKALIPNLTNFCFIFPTDNQKFIIKFKSLVKYNQWSKIRIRELKGKNYFLICNFFLGPKKEMSIPIFPNKDDLLHWKAPNNLQVTASIKKEKESVDLSNDFTIYASKEEYSFIYKNDSTGNAIFNVWIGYSELENV